jgi:antitoxin component YwqK of YwqJK toxin-antitoxin module
MKKEDALGIAFALNLVLLSGCASQIQEAKQIALNEDAIQKIEEGKERIVSSLVFREKVGFALNEDKPFTGRLIDYYSNGNKKADITYKNGKVHGLYNLWFENGNRKYEVGYVDGVEHGKHIVYYENGNIEEMSNMNYGKPDGLLTYFKESGNKFIEINYKNGKKDGRQLIFLDNGYKGIEKTYKDDRQVGEELFFGDNGEVICKRAIGKEATGKLDLLGCERKEEKRKEKITGGVVKCINPLTGNVEYTPSDHFRDRQGNLNLPSSCREVMPGMTESERIKATKQRYDMEKRLAKEAYDRKVRETANFLDDVEAARKRK